MSFVYDCMYTGPGPLSIAQKSPDHDKLEHTDVYLVQGILPQTSEAQQHTIDKYRIVYT